MNELFAFGFTFVLMMKHQRVVQVTERPEHLITYTFNLLSAVIYYYLDSVRESLVNEIRSMLSVLFSYSFGRADSIRTTQRYIIRHVRF